jgi:hypothetical protein
MRLFIKVFILNAVLLFVPKNTNSTTILLTTQDITSQKDTSISVKKQQTKPLVFKDKKLFKRGLWVFLTGIGLLALGTSGFLFSFIAVLFLVCAQIALITGLMMMLFSLAPPAQSRRFTK